MLKSCKNIRFLAISTDSVELEADFTQVFSRVQLSVQHLFLEFDSCYFLDASTAEFPKSPRHRYTTVSQAKTMFKFVRPFVPSNTQLHVLFATTYDLTGHRDVLRETFDTSCFVSSMEQAESV
jgi:hypothetical protein